TLLDFLRIKYDDIILDSPPVQLVTDAMILSHLADVTLFVIRQGHTYKSLLPLIKNIYDDQHFQNANILFNGIDKRKFGYGNNYSNGYYQQKKRKLFHS